MSNIGIPFLDITEALREVRLTEAPLYRQFDEHFTEAGHRAAARIIAPFIGENY